MENYTLVPKLLIFDHFYFWIFHFDTKIYLIIVFTFQSLDFKTWKRKQVTIKFQERMLSSK
jgi:hypothetical protein